MSWHTGRLCGFDLETTGVNLDEDRIVTACVVQCGGRQPTQSATWLADPGIEIPAGAAQVHGITTEKARADGRPAAEVIGEVLAALGQAIAHGLPVVAMNARFDLTLLDREARRYGLDPLPAGFPVVDPYVIDKAVDRYRRGSRKLVDLCTHYEVLIGDAHTADADAIAACRVAWRQGQRYERLAAMSLDELYTAQIGWAADQAASLQAFLRQKNPDAVCPMDWPLVPHQKEGD